MGGTANDDGAKHERAAQARRAASSNSTTSNSSCGDGVVVRVWDLGVRAFHWCLVACVGGSLATGFLAPRWWLDGHVILGVLVAALMLFRMVWGVYGSTYARFASFLVSPLTALRHAGAIVAGKARHYVGHNPVGTMMIVLLIVALFALVVSGVATLGGVQKEGPLAAMTYHTGVVAKTIHAAMAWCLLALIAGHLGGVVIESLRTRENLVGSMITGAKHVGPEAVVATTAEAQPARTAVVVVLLAALLIPAVVLASLRQVAGVPREPLDPLYAKECSACHSAHHPSLAPAATWLRLIDGLSDHFDDNASLEPDQAQRLKAYLAANSAGAWDTKAANMMRAPDAKGSLRITHTEGWKAIHHAVVPAAFTAKAVNGQLNCAACHSDSADGRFAARSISLPTER